MLGLKQASALSAGAPLALGCVNLGFWREVCGGDAHLETPSKSMIFTTMELDKISQRENVDTEKRLEGRSQDTTALKGWMSRRPSPKRLGRGSQQGMKTRRVRSPGSPRDKVDFAGCKVK